MICSPLKDALIKLANVTSDYENLTSSEMTAFSSLLMKYKIINQAILHMFRAYEHANQCRLFFPLQSHRQRAFQHNGFRRDSQVGQNKHILRTSDQ